MTRNPCFAVTTLQVFILAFLSADSQTATAANDKPNVLFIFADDQCFETIGALGHEVIETPNLDRLVETGITFTDGGWH